MPISSSANGLTKPAGPGTAAIRRVASSRSADVPSESGQVLAQIPDLDKKPSPLASFKRLDGRLISQAVSLKLVFGLGIGLIIGAILPFLFGRGSSPKPVHELSDWTNVRNMESTNSSTALSDAPPWQTPPPRATAVAPQAASPDISVPPPPAGDYRPAVMNRRTWSPPQGTAAPPSGNLNPDYAHGNPPPPRTGDRGYGPGADRNDMQADRRNDPAPRYGNPPGYENRGNGYDYRGNPADGPAMRRDIQPPAPAGDERYRYPADPNGPRQYAPAAPQGNNGAGYYYRNQPQPDPESGVARFDGTITAPPARTNP